MNFFLKVEILEPLEIYDILDLTSSSICFDLLAKYLESSVVVMDTVFECLLDDTGL